MRPPALLCLAIALLSGGCPEEVRELELVFGVTINMKTRPPDGIACVVAPGNYLIEELWTDAEPGGCMVIDLVDTQGARGCRLAELAGVCTEAGCTPQPQYRVRMPLSGDPPSADNLPVPQRISNWLVDQVSSEAVFDDAPETLAIIRATIVRTACEDVGDKPRFACADVVGCVFSCPVDIGTFSGEVVLELDSLNDMTCIRDVRVCASDRMFDRERAMDENWCDTDPMVP